MANGKKVTCFDCAQVNRVPDDKIGASAKCGTCGAKLFGDKVKDLDFATLQKAARNDDVPLVVDFWAPWCGPCRMMAPEFAKASNELCGKARLVKVNTEAQQKAGQMYNIRSIPTMAVFGGGREKARQSGAQQSRAIVDWVRGVK
mgnify:CR=1 FL=1